MLNYFLSEAMALIVYHLSLVRAIFYQELNNLSFIKVHAGYMYIIVNVGGHCDLC